MMKMCLNYIYCGTEHRRRLIFYVYGSEELAINTKSREIDIDVNICSIEIK